MKPKSTSVLDGLPANQAEALERWLFEENISLDDARSRLQQDFCVSTSRRALSVWYQKRGQERMLLRIRDASRESRQVVEIFRSNPDNSYEALLGLIGQAALEAKLTGKNLDLATLKDLAELTRLGLEARHDTRMVEIKERDLALKEVKFRRETCELFLKWFVDEKAKAIATSNESNASKIEKLGQEMFGDLWK